MLKRIVLLLVSLFTITGVCFANDINVSNYKAESRIGPIGVKDSFDMSELNTLFGKMTKPATVGGFATKPLLLTFENAQVVVIDNALSIIRVTASTAQNGVALGTPRGIVVGHDLDTVFRLYGTPYRTWRKGSNTVYHYGNEEVGVSFEIDASTNRVVEITVSVPTC